MSDSPVAALRRAIDEGRVDGVAEACRLGADPNGSPDRRWSPIGHALRQRRVEVALALVRAGAQLASWPPGWAPLGSAALTGSADLVGALVAQGANVHERVCMAIPSKHWFPVMPSSPFTARNGAVCDGTSLSVAAWHGHADVADRLLAAGAELEAIDAHGRSALAIAVQGGHAAVAEVLRARGAVLPTPLDASRRLLAAVHAGATEDARLALRAGARADAVEVGLDGAMPALSLAAQAGNVGLVELLIETGADLHAVAWSGRYDPIELALRFSAGSEGEEPLTQSLRAGTKVTDIVWRSGLTPLDFAARGGHLTALDRLLSAGARSPHSLSASALGGSLAAIDRLLASHDQREHHLALRIACASDQRAAALRLIEVTGDAEGVHDGACLTHAVGWRAVEVVRALLRRGGGGDGLGSLMRVAKRAKCAEVIALIANKMANIRSEAESVPELGTPLATDFRRYARRLVLTRLAKRADHAAIADLLGWLHASCGARAKRDDALGGWTVAPTRGFDLAELSRRAAACATSVVSLDLPRAGSAPAEYVVIPSSDPLDVVAALGTAGPNFGKHTMDVLRYVANVARHASFRLTWINEDGLSIALDAVPIHVDLLVDATVKICPEVVDGPTDRQALRVKILRDRTITLWWD